MKLKIVLETEVEEEDLSEMGLRNVRYLITDALHDFENVRRGTCSVEQYVNKRYAMRSQEWRLQKIHEVEARLSVSLCLRQAAHVAVVTLVEENSAIEYLALDKNHD